MLRLRDEVRRALQPAALGMQQAIDRLRELGRDEDADALKAVRDELTAVGNRAVRNASPRGRVVVPPIAVTVARAATPQRPPVGVDEWRAHVAMLREQYAVRAHPPLRIVQLRPMVKAGSRGEVLDAG